MPLEDDNDKFEDGNQYQNIYDQVSASDAVHPLFIRYENIRLDTGTDTWEDLQDEGSYYCRECNERFPVGIESVVQHFANRTHMPVDSCVYCRGPVSDYYHKGKRMIFHSCNPTSCQSNNNNSQKLFSSVKNKLTTSSSTCDMIGIN